MKLREAQKLRLVPRGAGWCERCGRRSYAADRSARMCIDCQQVAAEREEPARLTPLAGEAIVNAMMAR